MMWTRSIAPGNRLMSDHKKEKVSAASDSEMTVMKGEKESTQDPLMRRLILTYETSNHQAMHLQQCIRAHFTANRCRNGTKSISKEGIE